MQVGEVIFKNCKDCPQCLETTSAGIQLARCTDLDCILASIEESVRAESRDGKIDLDSVLSILKKYRVS